MLFEFPHSWCVEEVSTARSEKAVRRFEKESSSTGDNNSELACPLIPSCSSFLLQLDLKVDNLAQAKDRAQLTATGAMSVVHVALLKEVLDKGKDNMRYFTVAISLICISLALQILAGILALVVSHLRSYYAKYKDDLIEDMFENLCCCRTVSNRAASSRKIARARHLTLGEDVIDGTELAERNVASDDEAKRQNEEDEPLAAAASQLWCCGCACGRNRVLSNYEYDVLEMYDEWGAEHTEMELLAAEADVQVPYLSGQFVLSDFATQIVRHFECSVLVKRTLLKTLSLFPSTRSSAQRQSRPTGTGGIQGQLRNRL